MKYKQEEYRYKHMVVWKEAIEFSSLIISCTQAISPHVKNKGFLTKIEVTALSVPAKIAYGKTMGKGFGYLKALKKAEGNVHILVTHLQLMRQLKWISASEFAQLENAGLRLAVKIKSLVNIVQMCLEN
jgi:four helix bundle protein